MGRLVLRIPVLAKVALRGPCLLPVTQAEAVTKTKVGGESEALPMLVTPVASVKAAWRTFCAVLATGGGRDFNYSGLLFPFGLWELA